MDNITHSLIGAAIGQTGLKKLSGLGMPTLIIAANIPDIDAACFFWLDGAEHLGFRRGITHGPLAMLVLPLLLTAAMIGFDRWQARRGKRPATRLPVRPLQLYWLALIGTLSHPAFDWLNSYGIRLLEPFSSRWFYGDTLFIIDIWLWGLLIGGLVWSRAAEKAGGNWQRRGLVVATVLATYVFANGVITGHAESAARTALTQRVSPGAAMPDLLVVANAVPFAFWRREIEWRDEAVYGTGKYSVAAGVRLTPSLAPIMCPPGPDCYRRLIASTQHNAADPRIAAIAARDPQVRAFLFWSRMPVVATENGDLVLRDQRFMDPLAVDRFTVRARLMPQDAAPRP
jgi:inner membrane protein